MFGVLAGADLYKVGAINGRHSIMRLSLLGVAEISRVLGRPHHIASLIVNTKSQHCVNARIWWLPLTRRPEAPAVSRTEIFDPPRSIPPT